MSIDAAKQRILAGVSLADLIGDSISPQRVSGQIRGLCPFHAEKTPSFYIYDDHYHCYGCKAHGDAITYAQKTQGLGFIESLRWLATKYSIPAPELDESRYDRRALEESAKQAKAILAAQEFFVSSLSSPQGQKAREYLESRGFSSEKIKEFGFGYAPASGRPGVTSHLLSLGHTFPVLKTCSLANGDRGRFREFFEDRVMIPIRDLQGRLIAFGGRNLAGDFQKYKNSRYDKGSTLFGMDRARKAMQKKARAFVVEGYMDVLQLWSSGFDEAVACQGTALTVQHMRQLANATKLAYLIFDGDEAGRSANLKLIEDALTVPDIEFRVVLLPDGQDPDSVLRSQGPEELERYLKESIDLTTFCIDSHLSDTHSEGIPALVSKELLPWIQQIKDPIKRTFLAQRIASRTGIPVKALRETLMGSKRDRGPEVARDEPESADELELRPISSLGRELIGHIFYAREGELDSQSIQSILVNELGDSKAWIDFGLELLDAYEAGLPPADQDIGRWVTTQIPQVADFVDWLEGHNTAFLCHDRQKRVKLIEDTLEHRTLKAQKSVLRRKINRLGTGQEDTEGADQLLLQVQAISSKLVQLEKRLQGGSES